jgi:hypothetical protein
MFYAFSGLVQKCALLELRDLLAGKYLNTFLQNLKTSFHGEIGLFCSLFFFPISPQCKPAGVLGITGKLEELINTHSASRKLKP